MPSAYPVDENLWRLPDRTFMDEMAPPPPPATRINSTLDPTVLHYHGHTRPHKAPAQEPDEQHQRSSEMYQEDAETLYPNPFSSRDQAAPPAARRFTVAAEQAQTQSEQQQTAPFGSERQSPAMSRYPPLDTDWDAERREAASGYLRIDYSRYLHGEHPNGANDAEQQRVVQIAADVLTYRPQPTAAAQIPDELIDPRLRNHRSGWSSACQTQ